MASSSRNPKDKEPFEVNWSAMKSNNQTLNQSLKSHTKMTLPTLYHFMHDKRISIPFYLHSSLVDNLNKHCNDLANPILHERLKWLISNYCGKHKVGKIMDPKDQEKENKETQKILKKYMKTFSPMKPKRKLEMRKR